MLPVPAGGGDSGGDTWTHLCSHPNVRVRGLKPVQVPVNAAWEQNTSSGTRARTQHQALAQAQVHTPIWARVSFTPILWRPHSLGAQPVGTDTHRPAHMHVHMPPRPAAHGVGGNAYPALALYALCLCLANSPTRQALSRPPLTNGERGVPRGGGAHSLSLTVESQDLSQAARLWVLVSVAVHGHHRVSRTPRFQGLLPPRGSEPHACTARLPP